jgi:hypothetical protein
LSYFARELLEQNGDVPLIAARELMKGSSSHQWSPEILLTYPTGDSIELDIALIVDGKIMVGEAKSNSRISGASWSAKKAARRLVQAARVLTADEIVLATSKSQWAPNVFQSMDAAIDELWDGYRKPRVRPLTDCGC